MAIKNFLKRMYGYHEGVLEHIDGSQVLGRNLLNYSSMVVLI